MQSAGVRGDQVSQVRGFADQRLRLPQAPEDPSNRRISLIVQYATQNADEMMPKDALENMTAAAPQPSGGPSQGTQPGGAPSHAAQPGNGPSQGNQPSSGRPQGK
jgi:chemotaxis protein MotB